MTYTLSSYCFLRRMTTLQGPRRRCSSPMIQRGTLSPEAFVSFESSTAPGRILKSPSRESGACSLRTFFDLVSFQSFPTNEVLRKIFLGWRLARIYPRGQNCRPLSSVTALFPRISHLSLSLILPALSFACHENTLQLSFSPLACSGWLHVSPASRTPAAYRSSQFCA